MTTNTASILGAGNVGAALARAFVAKGQPVVLGVTDPGKYQATIGGLGHGRRFAFARLQRWRAWRRELELRVPGARES